MTEISYIAEFYFSVFSSTTRSTFLAEKCTHIVIIFVAHSLYVVYVVKGALGDFRFMLVTGVTSVRQRCK